MTPFWGRDGSWVAQTSVWRPDSFAGVWRSYKHHLWFCHLRWCHPRWRNRTYAGPYCSGGRWGNFLFRLPSWRHFHLRNLQHKTRKWRHPRWRREEEVTPSYTTTLGAQKFSILLTGCGNHRPHSRHVSVPDLTVLYRLTSTIEYSSRPTTRAEQRWVRWLQCLIRKWSCVNYQFQFNTQIAYEPTYMAHDLYYVLLVNYWHWHKIESHQFGNPFFGTLAQPFHFRQWLRVCAMKTGTSYFGNLFPTCQDVLGHACHIWHSLWLKSLTHNHSTRAGPVRIHCVTTGVFGRKWLKRITYWGVISLTWCRIMAVQKCCTFRLKRKKYFITHPWRLLCVVGLEEYSAHDWRAATSGTARSSYLARVGPVVEILRRGRKEDPTVSVSIEAADDRMTQGARESTSIT